MTASLKQRKGPGTIKGVDFDMVGGVVWIASNEVAVRITKHQSGSLSVDGFRDGKRQAFFTLQSK